MKSKISLFFVLFNVMTIASSFGAKNSSVGSTPHAYKEGDFCTETAKAQILELNNQTQAKSEEINHLKTEINNLTGKSKLIGGYLKLKDDYLQSISDFAQAKTEMDSANLDNANPTAFRKLINNSLAMSLVNNIAIANSPNAKSMAELCSDLSNEKVHNSNFCQKLNSDEITPRQKAYLDKMYANVTIDIQNVTEAEKQKAKKELQIIYATIPNVLSPDQIIADLIATTTNPNIVKAVDDITPEDRKLIASCLEPSQYYSEKRKISDNDCKTIMTNSEKMKIYKNNFLGQIGEAHLIIKNKIEGELATLTKPVLENESFKNAKEGLSKTTEELLNYLKNDKNKEKLSSLGLTSNSVAEFIEACATPEASLTELCKTKAASINALFEKQNAEVEKDLQEKMALLNKIIDPTGELYKLERLKQFVQTKYLRTCPNAEIDKEIYATNFCTKLSGVLKTSTDDPDALESLNKNLAAIVNALQPNKISASKGELGAFTKSELDIFKNDCENKSIDSETMQKICSDINDESRRIADQKESKEWDEFHKKYWVKRNENSTKGYDVYEKKTAGRIIGDGITKITGRIAPMIIGNMNLNYQIDMMTNQAIYMKQLNYMNDPNSSWMMNNSYFQGNYFNQSTPFTGFDATTINTATPAGAGFNFSN